MNEILYEIRMLIKITYVHRYKINNQSKSKELIREQLEDKSKGRG